MKDTEKEQPQENPPRVYDRMSTKSPPVNIC